MHIPPDIRPAAPEDAATLAAFGAPAFTDTYRDISDAQEIADYVAEHFRPDVIARVILDPACTTLLAWAGEQLAGYAIVKATPAPPCVTGPTPIELSRLYLGEGFIGQGLGGRLMRAVHAEARRRGAGTLWLGVYDRNVRAVEFYERVGFTKVGGKEFLFGGRIYIDPIYAAAVPAAPKG
jgi:GNAT superfamily N-acetyltransferase